MKIKSIESFVLADKLKETFYFSQWEYSERRICIVKVTSDTGHVGWGEGYGPAGVLKAGIDHLSQYLIGMNPSFSAESPCINRYKGFFDQPSANQMEF